MSAPLSAAARAVPASSRQSWARCFLPGVALAAALLLGGCATPVRTGVPGDAAWSGRLALRMDSAPPQSFSAGFDLLGSPRQGQLALFSPLGNTLATVSWSPAGAELRQGTALTRRGSLDELTTELGGTALPVAALFDWMHGRPADSSGWEVDLSRHAEGRVTARRIAPPPSAELRLVFEP